MNNRFFKLKEQMIAAMARFSAKEAQEKEKDFDAWMNPRFRCSKCRCEGMHKEKEDSEESKE